MSHLAQTRDLLVKQRSALKAKINNLLSAEGINLKKESLSSNKALDRVLAMPLPPILAAEARVLVGQIRSLTSSIAELEELIEAEGPKLAGHRNLMSIKGIGPVSAAVLLSAIGDIRDFSDPGRLSAYLGLVPRVTNSNETERSGHITKHGNKLARTALVQCALIAKRYSSYLQQFYQRIQRRRGGGKANIALARKFLGVIYHTLKNNWATGSTPDQQTTEKLAMGIHWGYGVLWGGLFGALRNRVPVIGSAAGLTYGTGLWLIGDELMMPVLKLSPPSTDFPWQNHARAFTIMLRMERLSGSSWRHSRRRPTALRTK